MIGHALASLALAVVSQEPAASSAYELDCALIGRDDARARFTLVVGPFASDRRFAIRSESPSSPWIRSISAGRSLEGNRFHFISEGFAYRLDLDLQGEGASLSATARLAEDKGSPALDRRLAQGSCRGRTLASGWGDLPALPRVDEVQAVRHETRPIDVAGSRLPTDCTVVLRDLREIHFGLDASVEADGVAVAVAPADGSGWPTAPFTVRGAALAAMTRPAGSSVGFATILGSAGASAGSEAPARLGFEVRADAEVMDLWVDLRGNGAHSDIAGAGHCRPRPNQGG